MFNNCAALRGAVVVAFVLDLACSGAAVAAAATEESARLQPRDVRVAQTQPAPGQSADPLSEYRLILQRLEQASTYNRNLAEVVADQQRVMSRTEQNLVNIERSRQDLVPLMLDMVDSLERFVELDLPFHLDERRDRLARLRDSMGDSGYNDAEKLRRVMEAYQVEIDFGRTIDAYTGWLEGDGVRREVNFLRIGRVVLAYQTHDQRTTGFYNAAQRQWQPLPDEYRAEVADGLRIARKQAAPELIRLPVTAPVATQ